MPEDPQQTRLRLVTRVIDQLTAQQVDLIMRIRALRSAAALAASPSCSDKRLARPTKRDYDYFTELEAKLSGLVAQMPGGPRPQNGDGQTLRSG